MGGALIRSYDWSRGSDCLQRSPLVYVSVIVSGVGQTSACAGKVNVMTSGATRSRVIDKFSLS